MVGPGPSRPPRWVPLASNKKTFENIVGFIMVLTRAGFRAVSGIALQFMLVSVGFCFQNVDRIKTRMLICGRKNTLARVCNATHSHNLGLGFLSFMRAIMDSEFLRYQNCSRVWI